MLIEGIDVFNDLRYFLFERSDLPPNTQEQQLQKLAVFLFVGHDFFFIAKLFNVQNFLLQRSRLEKDAFLLKQLKFHDGSDQSFDVHCVKLNLCFLIYMILWGLLLSLHVLLALDVFFDFQFSPDLPS